MAFSFPFSTNPTSPRTLNPHLPFRSPKTLAIQCGLRELRHRIDSVKSTQKITEAMKLVAAAKVRRAQEAVVNGRPFAETLAEVLFELNDRLQADQDVDFPLTEVRPVRKVAIVVVSGDRGLCGGLYAAVIRKAEARIAELKGLGLDYSLISVGKKGNSHFGRKFGGNVAKFAEAGNFPTAKEAQAIADAAFAMFVSGEVDKVELVYSKFVSLVKFEPVIRTLLPLKRNLVDLNGNFIDPIDDELFRLTSKQGKLSLERESRVRKRDNEGFSPPILYFEQDPVQILDAMMPLYLNSQVLRALQEATASELASRMGAMSSATDNAVELTRSLSRAYNRERQAKITGEILEIVAGAEALTELD